MATAGLKRYSYARCRLLLHIYIFESINDARLCLAGRVVCARTQVSIKSNS